MVLDCKLITSDLPLEILTSGSQFSFTFTGLLMAMYSYVAASRLLKLSEMPDVDIHVPTTYQIATLIRVLNAEPLTLYQVFVQKIKSVFWKKAKSEIATSGMHVTALSILVLSFSFTARYVEHVPSIWSAHSKIAPKSTWSETITTHIQTVICKEMQRADYGN